MNTEYLLDLLAFKRCGTLSKAAVERHITQPSLSRNMQKLEEELGCELFERSRNSLTLNENGEIAVKYAEIILQDCERMKSEIQRNIMRHTRISIVSCAPMPQRTLGLKLEKHFPDMTVQSTLNPDNIPLSLLSDGTYRIAVLSYRPDHPDIISIPFQTEHLYISVPENHALAGEKSVSFSSLDGMTFLLNRQIGIWHDFVKKEMPHSAFLLQEDAYAVNTIAEQSDIPAFTTDLAIRINGLRHNHKAVMISDPSAVISFYVCYLRSSDDMFSFLRK